jgi:hypothetical protein
MNEEEQKEPIISTPNICVVRLVNGDEIYGDITLIERTDNDGGIKLDNPLSLEYKNFDDGSEGKVFVRYNPPTRYNMIIVPAIHVVYMSPVSDLMTEYYLKAITYAEKYIDEQVEKSIKGIIKAIDSVLIPPEVIVGPTVDPNRIIVLAEINPGNTTRH